MKNVNGAFHILSLAYNIPCRRLYGQVHFAAYQVGSYPKAGIAAIVIFCEAIRRCSQFLSDILPSPSA